MAARNTRYKNSKLGCFYCEACYAEISSSVAVHFKHYDDTYYGFYSDLPVFDESLSYFP